MQEDLGGELYSWSELLPSRECAATFIDFIDIFPWEQYENVFNDKSLDFVFRDIMADAPADTPFWVNAQRVPSTPLYRFEGEYPIHSYEYNPQGDCLTYSQSDGLLTSRVRKISLSLMKSIIFNIKASLTYFLKLILSVI